MGALGLLALFIRANFSLICNTPRDGVFPDRVKIKITISGGTAPPGAKKDILFNDLFWGSDHPSVAQFAFADGSVHTLADDTDLEVLRSMATRNGQEVEGQFVFDNASCFGAPPPQR